MSLESTTSEESTTSSREGQDEDWYREAVNSSDERDPAIIKSKDKSKHPDVPSKENRSPQKKRASHTTRPSPEKPRQAMKRVRDQENRPRPETDAAPIRFSAGKHMVSEIGPNMHVSHTSQESPKQLREAFSVHHFLSESDINSDGEATKTYTLPTKHVSRSVISGEVVPLAFAKTNIKTKESQIY